MTSGGWFNGLYKSSLSKIETHIKQLREYLPFEIWKQPQDIPKQSQALQDRLKWWREYIESLDRPLNLVELYYMPIRLIPNAMWHDFKVVWKGLLGDELFHRLGAVIKRLESRIG